MIFSDVNNQLNAIFVRVIETGVSVQQRFPKVSNDGIGLTLGSLAGSSIPLKDVAYSSIYTELESNDFFHIKLPDGGLLVFQYAFDAEESLRKHRLAFFPSPILPTVEETPELYRYDELYGDILSKQIVRFPIRFDFDPKNYRPRYHAHSHLTLGQFHNCRIPVTHAVSPNGFLLFVLRNFYHKLYLRHSNVFEKRLPICSTASCITVNERFLPHFGF